MLSGHPPSHSHSHRVFPTPLSRLLLSPRRAGRPRAHRLPAGETSALWRAAVGRDCGNGGVLPERARLPRLSPPLPQQRNPVWGAWAVLCRCELWHSPLRQRGARMFHQRIFLAFICLFVSYMISFADLSVYGSLLPVFANVLVASGF